MVILAVTAGSAYWLPAYHHHLAVMPSRVAWWRVWADWDGDWYRRIAQSGYGYARHGQQSIAFFPSYPLVVRLVAFLTGNVVVAGVLTTLASGAAVAVLFGEWLSDRLARPAAVASLLALLVYPYAFYLYGPMYADALFLACAIGAFVALERGYPWVAGALGAVAVAARPIGIVLVVGLIARGWELTRSETAQPKAKFAAGDRRRVLMAVSVSALGLAGYMGYLWVTRGDALAFVSAEQGWHQSPGVSTWFKTALFTHVSRAQSIDTVLRLVAHPIVMIVALALIPRVVKRFGRAYGLYAALAILLPAVATKDFFGMGRYALAAFPCFAAAGDLITTRPRVARLGLAASAAVLILVATQFGRGAYLS